MVVVVALGRVQHGRRHVGRSDGLLQPAGRLLELPGVGGGSGGGGGGRGGADGSGSSERRRCDAELPASAAVRRVAARLRLRPVRVRFIGYVSTPRSPCSEKVVHFVFEHNFSTTSSIFLQFSVTVTE